MSLPDLINQFNFPAEARADFDAMGLTQKKISSNSNGSVTEYSLSGHEKGVGYRFFIHAVKNEIKSQEADLEINDDIQMVEWFKNKKEKPVERVHLLPEQLLKFRKKKNPTTNQMEVVFPLECVGGAYADDYKRWRAGLTGTGLELSRWNKVTVGQVKTLNSEGVFTVEQFASMDRSAVEARFPKDLQKAFQDAVHFCNAQEPIAGIKEQADKVLALEQELSKERDARASMERRLAAMEAGDVKRKPGRPKKTDEMEAAAFGSDLDLVGEE